WSRIPHFYYNYYVYQYSTGFSAASALAKKILAGEPDALTNYLNYLKAGRSDYPIEVMKKAGVDMTKADYIEDAMKVFEQRLNELEELVKEIEA
ncbi:MAG: M3 family metallopeptidase, partial [Enterococcus casseliflavus]